METPSASLPSLTLRCSIKHKEMRRRLGKKPEIADHIIPNFAVGCSRLTPGEGYLEVLQESNVEFIPEHVQQTTTEGIVSADDRSIHLNVLVRATGFRAAKAPPFPIYGSKGVRMGTRFGPFTETYLSMCMDGYPNFFTILGPNSLIGTGRLTMILESECDYITKCVRKLQRENMRSMDAKTERVKTSPDIVELFKQSVYLGGCTSRYRNEGGRGDRVIGLWKRFALLGGNTSTMNMRRMQVRSGSGDLAFYLEPEYLDVPAKPLPEATHR
ncbi:hypothetical protein LTR96_011018 [Exophiala xenobiotica]|nr:hypothetical protein LTR96_011018 [Exophiala xenobiotica]KAK5332943.1 hypothetical protein LTR98_010942 [Exophiala xenobiotica]